MTFTSNRFSAYNYTQSLLKQTPESYCNSIGFITGKGIGEIVDLPVSLATRLNAVLSSVVTILVELKEET